MKAVKKFDIAHHGYELGDRYYNSRTDTEYVVKHIDGELWWVEIEKPTDGQDLLLDRYIEE